MLDLWRVFVAEACTCSALFIACRIRQVNQYKRVVQGAKTAANQSTVGDHMHYDDLSTVDSIFWKNSMGSDS